MPGPVPDDSASASGWVLGALCHPARIDAARAARINATSAARLARALCLAA
jgi:hypothetical protein